MIYDANGALLESVIPGVPMISRGKVRDIYDLGDALLFVATDRLSAFDVVLPNGIPGKGAVLTGISLFWQSQTTGYPLSKNVTSSPARHSFSVGIGQSISGSFSLCPTQRLPLE